MSRFSARTTGVAALVAALCTLVACGPGDDDRTGAGALISAPVGEAVVRLNDPVAAEVDGSPIYISDIQREGVAQGLLEQGESITADDAEFDQLLEELIDQRLLALDAVRRGLDDTEEARRRIAVARERILGNIVVESVVDAAVTEDALRRMYEEQVQLVELGDEVRARHILVETQEEADAVVDLLREGVEFSKVALERSLDEMTRLEGGDLGYFTPSMITRPVARAAFAADVGALAGPVKSDYGWHVLLIEDRRAETRPTFEEMRPRIVRFMTFDEIQRLIDVLRARSEVRRFAGPKAAGAEAGDPDGESDGAP